MDRWYVPFVAGVLITLAALWLERDFKKSCCSACAGGGETAKEPL